MGDHDSNSIPYACMRHKGPDADNATYSCLPLRVVTATVGIWPARACATAAPAPQERRMPREDDRRDRNAVERSRDDARKSLVVPDDPSLIGNRHGFNRHATRSEI
jgi:hypothetical protein